MTVMDAIERLTHVEEIKRLKARYFYYLDTKDWARWKAEVWAEDGSLDAPVLSAPVVGVDNIIAFTSSAFEHVIPTHYGHMPDIEILSPEAATGIWAMQDIIRAIPGRPAPFHYVHGFGHYHETYVRTAAGWRIRSTRLTRLHVEHVDIGAENAGGHG
jgi:SnoaL-like domain